ncbi:GvpL/GvpF family gas vesicle protein [Streptomyces sp. NRRL B-24572]|uniref:GvpL/GvpF family gas vesicle protein n=1 Tax=Streptomyces sp. NRRL B-24572 TaxID=1962156 RepID=UPI000A39305A|nr:GvpL/GvpF family gas vesicle protein [Streptomyces sp. NRRL B-24572]
MDGELSYAYAVVRPTAGLTEGPLTGVTGVASGAVRLVVAGAVAAAVGSVPRDDFSEAALKVHLEDLDWLERVARAHHGVVEFLASHTTVLPLRLATVYVDDDRVRDVLRRGEETFTRMLNRFADHVEWGVKVYAEIPRGPAAPEEADAAASDPGRTYLRRRRQQREDRGAAWSAAAEAVRRVEAEAGQLAVELARHRPQQGQLAVGTGENVANDSYLVPGSRSEEFRERVRDSTRELSGVRVEITGPWAPYSFAVLPEPEAPEEGPRP